MSLRMMLLDDALRFDGPPRGWWLLVTYANGKTARVCSPTKAKALAAADTYRATFPRLVTATTVTRPSEGVPALPVQTWAEPVEGTEPRALTSTCRHEQCRRPILSTRTVHGVWGWCHDADTSYTLSCPS